MKEFLIGAFIAYLGFRLGYAFGYEHSQLGIPFVKGWLF